MNNKVDITKIHIRNFVVIIIKSLNENLLKLKIKAQIKYT